jgi:hypothetical protein
MFARGLRTLVFLAIIGFGLSKLVRVLRGQAAPQFSNHPTVNGGPGAVPDEPEPAASADEDQPEDEAEPDDEDQPEDENEAEPDHEPEDDEPAADEPEAEPAALPVGDQPDGVLADPTDAIAGVLAAPDPAPELAAPPTSPQLAAPAPTLALDDAVATRWVEPVDGSCPEGYPIKGKVKSGIFHVPGSLAYDRTKADRCYATEEDAIADGLRAPKR